MYKVTTDHQSQEQVDALPADALLPLAELMAMLEVAPWGATPYNELRPDSPMRACAFGSRGEGMVTYLILEDQRRVDLLDVQWAGRSA